MTIPHLRGKLFGEGGQRIIQQGGAGFGEFGLLSPRSCLGRRVVRVRGEVFRSGSRFLMTSICDFCQRDPKVPSSHCSHIRRMSLEERSLLGLPHRSRRKTGFGRHMRSVEALFSLCVDTSDKATKRQRAQASSVAFGTCVRIWVEKTSCRLGVSGWRGQSMN